MAMLMDFCSINDASSLMALQLPLASANGLWILLIVWASALQSSVRAESMNITQQ
jgi:hypothetical protein